MNRDEPIVIRKVGNGFTVEPLGSPHQLLPYADVLVFNDMGFVGGNRDDSNVPYLLKFIAEHFTSPE